MGAKLADLSFVYFCLVPILILHMKKQGSHDKKKIIERLYSNGTNYYFTSIDLQLSCYRTFF